MDDDWRWMKQAYCNFARERSDRSCDYCSLVDLDSGLLYLLLTSFLLGLTWVLFISRLALKFWFSSQQWSDWAEFSIAISTMVLSHILCLSDRDHRERRCDYNVDFTLIWFVSMRAFQRWFQNSIWSSADGDLVAVENGEFWSRFWRCFWRGRLTNYRLETSQRSILIHCLWWSDRSRSRFTVRPLLDFVRWSVVGRWRRRDREESRE